MRKMMVSARRPSNQLRMDPVDQLHHGCKHNFLDVYPSLHKKNCRNYVGSAWKIDTGRKHIVTAGIAVWLCTVPCSKVKHTGLNYSVPSKPKKMALSALFLDTSRQKFWKSALAHLDAISSTGENFTTKVHYFFKNVCNIFSWFKPFSGHNMDIQQWAVKKGSDVV